MSYSSRCHHQSTSIILSSNNIQNGNILVPANPGPPGKWSLKWEERGEKGEGETIEALV